MRRIILMAAALASLLPAAAQAQSETDRLRDALRTLTAQVRSLEDARAALQAKQTESDRERDRLKKDNDALKKQVKDKEQDYRQAVEEFNQRLDERNDTLEKWKAAYAEAATVARTKDAERAKLETEAGSFRASSKACAARNVALIKVGNEILKHYDELTIGDMLIPREPLTGIRRVEVQNMLQDYRDKVLEQRVDQAEQAAQAQQAAQAPQAQQQPKADQDKQKKAKP
jgi:outer membrane murein-binding lipoprotein Lpp